MILPTEKYSFKLLTACFCGGADNQAAAEMRVPSIRGQVRAWQELAGAKTVNRIWGSTVGEAGASLVALFWDASVPPRQAQNKPYILPHKSQGRRPALAAGQSFTLTLQRLIGCSSADWTAAQNALKLWLLVGCLGLRANRAAGSVWPVGDWVPQTAAQLAETFRAQRLDAMIYPTMPFPAVRVVDTWPNVRTTLGLGNWLGIPEVSVPAGMGADGMPAGNVSFVGLPGSDARLLALAHSYERYSRRFIAPPVPT